MSGGARHAHLAAGPSYLIIARNEPPDAGAVDDADRGQIEDDDPLALAKQIFHEGHDWLALGPHHQLPGKRDNYFVWRNFLLADLERH